MKNHSLEQNLYSHQYKMLCASNARNYKNSASLFNAEVETLVKHGYFIESTQFESSTGEVLPREYHLKCIGESRTYKIKDFKTRVEAVKFYNELEFNKNGALILERFNIVNSNMFNAICEKHHCNERAYGDAYTSLYHNRVFSYLVSYCEGDIAIIHARTNKIFDVELKMHVDFFISNNY